MSKKLEINSYESRRKHRRYRPSKTICMRFKISNHTLVSGKVVDISKGGIAFTSDVFPIHLLKDQKEITIILGEKKYLAEVIHVSNKKCGCKFINKL